MAPKFRSNVWDPLLIISQIICMQCIYYVTTGLTIAFCAICFLDNGPQLRWLFDAQLMTFSTATGKCLFVSFLLSPLFCSLGLWRVVKRTKQCLDFASTIAFWHFIFCVTYSHEFPRSIFWWIATCISVVITTVMGEFLCMRTELKDIPLDSGNCARSS